MTVLVYYILTPAVYLAGARGTFGFLKRKNWGRILQEAKTCEHGFGVMHSGRECHPVVYMKNSTQVYRAFCAFAWPVWMPMVFLYKVVTAKW
jgi:hypothetical protein